MRRLSLFAVALLALGVGGQGWAAVPKPQVKLDLASIGSNQCTANTTATQVVNVTFVLDNYADSGYIGAWALDTVHRHLLIWRQPQNEYCAQIVDDGSSFVTLAGYGPTGESFVPAGIQGTFDGGYVIADIAGKFSPQYKTQGDLGTFNADCDVSFNCKGAHPSWLSYFSHVKTGGFAGWGWEYNAGVHGVWLDQADVSPPHGGDIR